MKTLANNPGSPDPRRAFYPALLVLLLSIAILSSCQEPTEPETVSLPVNISLRIADQSGAPLERAEVYYNTTGESARFEFAGISRGDGFVVLANQPLPLEGRDYWFRISPPPGFSTPEPLFVGPRHVPCRDTAFEVRLSRRVVIECGDTYEQNLEFLLCVDEQESETLCTPLLTHNCPNPLAVSVMGPDPAVAGLRLRIIDGNGNPLAATFALDAGQEFQICLEFSPNTALDAATTMSFTGANGNGDAISGRIGANLEATTCRDCDCPANLLRTYPQTGQDTACVGESVQIAIPLDLNNVSEQGCDWIFTLERDFTGGDLSILSLNGSNKFNSTLGSGRSLGPLRLVYTPSARGPYSDEAVYTVRARNRDGSDVGCESRLRIRFNGFGGEPECVIVRNPNDSTLVTTDPTFNQCVNQNEENRAKYLRIRNDGECPLELEPDLEIGNPFRLASQNISIAPGETRNIEIRFLPTDNNVWPGGRGDRPGTVSFSDVFEVSGCNLPPINLNGVSDTICSFVTNTCLHRYGEENGTYREGVLILEDTQLLFVNQADTTEIDFYVRDIDVAAGEAAIHSESGVEFKVVDSRSLRPNQTTCDFRNEYFGMCNDNGGWSPGLNAVSPNDIILFRRGNFCGIIWVAKIDLDRSDPNDALAQICVQICFPL